MSDTAIDATWTLVAGILVMFMQAGFVMLEGGAVRARGMQSILMKNILDVCISGVLWWLLGYGLAFGEDKGKFIGTSLFGVVNKDYIINDWGTDDQSFHYLMWFFQWAFCATAATIVSGALAERVWIWGYMSFSAVMTALIYPVVVHWTWGGGWLAEEGYTDFAGSGIVHMTGGVAALVGAAILGPRTGRWDETRAEEFAPHNPAMVVLGTLILWFGWYGFNAGSTCSMTGEFAANAQTAALVAVNTTIAACTGGLTSFIFQYALTRNEDISAIANGILAGLVSITAPCDGVYSWGAAVIGIIGGLLYQCASKLVKRVGVDDPLDAFAVHGACGAWGTLAVAFFHATAGVFYEGEGKQIGIQLMGIAAIAAWTAALSAVIFFPMRRTGMLRQSSVGAPGEPKPQMLGV